MHLSTGGINQREGYGEYKVLLINLHQTSADIYSINEHCLDISQPQIRRDLYNAGKSINKYSTQLFGSSSELFPKKYKPGVTMIGITGNVSGRLEEVGADGLGCWIWVQLTVGGGGRKKGSADTSI